MSLEAMTWALAAKVGDPTRKLVLITLANHAHRDGRNSWASRQTIAEYVECDPRTVRRHVQALIVEGWITEGDQAHVKHLRADRRPVVYDVAMTEERRRQWAADAETPPVDMTEPADETGVDVDDDTTDTGGQIVPPSPGDGGTPACPAVAPPRGDTTDRSSDVHGGTHGGTNPTPRGDTAVSPKPNTNQRTSPLPPSAVAACPKPGPTPHPNCRTCGTTPRQIQKTETKNIADAERRARIAADLDARSTPPPPIDPAARTAAATEARRRIAEARTAS